MAINIPGKLRLFNCLKNVLFISVLLSACTIPRKYQKDKPFVFDNTIKVNGGNFTSDEKTNLLQRLYGQLDDSSRVTIKDAFFILHYIDNPPAYDSSYSAISAKNMKASLVHLGYYNATDTFKVDTVTHNHQKRVYVTYIINAGNPTLIDTLSYRFNKPELEQLAIQTQKQSFLAKNQPVSREAILNEINRLVVLFRNNGYYKFTADDIKVIGDTTVAILTNASDDPFENLNLIEEAKNKRNKPTIKLALVLNPTSDTNRLKKFYINDVYIYPDFSPADTLNRTSFADTIITKNTNYIITYHKKLFRTSFLSRNIYFKKGDEYNQENYIKTINSFSQTGVWQSVIVQIEEKNKNKDSIGKIDIIIQLFPAKKYGFEANLEASFSTNSNTNTAVVATTGDLLGLSVNASLQNRNVAKEAIKMTNAVHAGVELNLSSLNTSQRINSNDLGITNTISLPKEWPVVTWLRKIPPAIIPFNFIRKGLDPKNLASEETFTSANISYVNRIELFNLLNLSFALGNTWIPKAHLNRKNTLKFPNIEFSYLYNQSDSFRTTLKNYPYLRYSFNTAFVMGFSFSHSAVHSFPRHPNLKGNLNWNIEQSGFPWSNLGIASKYIRQFIKGDIEYGLTSSHPKWSHNYHAFIGVGAPLGKSDSTLPFFKQYYAGGANSMRGWPVRGVGIGGQPLSPYNDTATTFNDKTGDIRIEANYEYRHDLWQIIPNSLTLRGALFFDIGNIWNFKNNHVGAGYDTLQFRWQNFYKQLGADVGAGLRFDFNYFLIRFDMGFRIKSPDSDEWKFPDVTFDHLFKRGVNNEDRIWRYENFNFSVGLNYPF